MVYLGLNLPSMGCDYKYNVFCLFVNTSFFHIFFIPLFITFFLN